ncbi:FAD-dependent oxidoreductase [Shewanella baltica]|uniref:FAD-dependent oxidoreductase n=1 Tax=Shewanella baltica TaxID=62322 RepID=UPI003D7AAAA6
MSAKYNKLIDATRRDFMKKSAFSAFGIASTSLLPSITSQAEAKPYPEFNCSLGIETPPAPISASQISEIITTDVVVVGAGISGVTASLSAFEAGAKTIVLQKGPVVMCHGTVMGAIDTKLQLEKGARINKMDAINEFMFQSLNTPNFRLVKKWADHSGEAFDWVNDITTKEGLPAKFLDKAGTASGESGKKYWFNSFSTAHTWKGGLMKAMNVVAKVAIAKGVDFRFHSPAVQLIRDKNGRVTGVISKSELTGKYTQFNAKKGVILCTGDYGGNLDMVSKYCPSAVGFSSYYTPAFNTGDGHLMGMWVGADLEDAPHTKMAHVHSSLDIGKGDAPGRGQPWLSVRNDGLRFTNEDIPFYLMGNQTTKGPKADGYYYNVFDADWEANLKQFPPRVTSPINPELFAQALKLGTIIKADTIEELARLSGIDSSNLILSVKRYNELFEKGEDEDFGKIAIDLSPIKKPPFYCIPRLPCVSTILGGLNINTDMQVLDEKEKVIEGLFAAGNVSGRFFGGANDYPFPIIGLSIGRAITFGRLAGQYVANSKV